MTSDLDALTAAVVASPDDLGIGQSCIDCCIENEREESAELTRSHLTADLRGRAELAAEYCMTWPVAAGLHAKALHTIRQAVNDLAEVFRSVGEGIAGTWARMVVTLRPARPEGDR